MLSAQHDCFYEQQDHRNHIRQQSPGGESDDHCHGTRSHPGICHVDDDSPEYRRDDELKHGDETRREQDSTKLGSVAKLQDGRDQVDDDDSEEFVDRVMLRVIDLAIDEAEVERE